MRNNQNLTLKKPKTKMAALAFGAGSLVLGAGLINIATPNSASAAERMAEVYIGATNLTLESYEGFEKAYLRISGPEGYRTLKAFESGEPMTVDLLSPDQFGPADGEPGWNAPLKAHTDLARGHYRYEVVYTFADGQKQAQSGSFFANDGMAFESPQAAGLPIPPRYEGLPSAKGGKSVGGKVGLKQDFDDLVQILDTVGDDQTQLFWGNANFANWRLDNRSGDLTAERFDGGGAVQMTLQADGDFGLRTTAPTDDLNIISDDGTPAIRLEDTTGEEDWQIVSGGSSTIQFDYEGTLGSANDVLTIAHTGNVGVGTGLDPSAPLHVQRSDGSAQVFVEDTGATDAPTMFSLLNRGGHPKFRLEDASQADVRWEFRTAGTEGSSERFQINKIGSGALNASFEANGDLEIAGSLSQGSSRAIKDDINPVDTRTVLAKLDALEISEWSYQSELSERHVGPMAEEFHATFGLGPDAKHIAPGDLAGVALAAAKALKAENEELKAKVAKMDQMESRLETLERRLGELTE